MTDTRLHEDKMIRRGFLAAAFLLAFLFLLIGSKDSPLYPMNNWPDINTYMTIGRGMLHGMTPYRDLFDHKGPLQYLLFWGVAAVSETGFIGLFLLEILAFGTYLYFSGKTAALYVKSHFARLTIMMILGMAVVSSVAFFHGGNTEELNLSFFAVSLYLLLKVIQEDREPRFFEAAVIGFAMGCAFWIKYTMCGFYVGMAFFMVVWYIRKKRPFAAFLRLMGAFFTGFLAITLLSLSYYAVKGILKDMFEVYFIQNLFSYNATEGSMARSIFLAVKHSLKVNLVYTVFFVPGLARLILRAKKHADETLALLFSFGALTLFTYYGGHTYDYYGLALAPFALFGLVFLAELAERLLEKRAGRKEMKKLPGWISPLFFVLFCGLLLFAEYRVSSNTYMLGQNKDTLVQYQFAKIINAEPGATVFTYNCLDAGFYLTTGTLPLNRSFCRTNMLTEDLKEDRTRMIENAVADYVITRGVELERFDVDTSKYKLVATGTGYLELNYFTYYLYRRIEP